MGAEMVLRLDQMQESSLKMEVWQKDIVRSAEEWQQKAAQCSDAQFKEMLQNWEALRPSLAEHDRCTRVVLRDVLPRLGSLGDAQDELREAVSMLFVQVSAPAMPGSGL